MQMLRVMSRIIRLYASKVIKLLDGATVLRRFIDKVSLNS